MFLNHLAATGSTALWVLWVLWECRQGMMDFSWKGRVV